VGPPPVRYHGLDIRAVNQYATPEQVSGGWSRRDGPVVWCQLFSEPDAGSGRAAVKDQGCAGRRGVGQRAEGVDLGRPDCHLGMATSDTTRRPQAAGITTMVIDMHGPGSMGARYVRSRNADFNGSRQRRVRAYDDVVGAPNEVGRWRGSPLRNERVSIGGKIGRHLPRHGSSSTCSSPRCTGSRALAAGWARC